MYNFSKPDFSQQQYNQDRFECMRAAQEPMLITSVPGMPAGGTVTNKNMFLACFRAKGYTVQSEEEREESREAEKRQKLAREEDQERPRGEHNG